MCRFYKFQKSTLNFSELDQSSRLCCRKRDDVTVSPASSRSSSPRKLTTTDQTSPVTTAKKKKKKVNQETAEVPAEVVPEKIRNPKRSRKPDFNSIASRPELTLLAEGSDRVRLGNSEIPAGAASVVAGISVVTPAAAAALPGSLPTPAKDFIRNTITLPQMNNVAEELLIDGFALVSFLTKEDLDVSNEIFAFLANFFCKITKMIVLRGEYWSFDSRNIAESMGNG